MYLNASSGTLQYSTLVGNRAQTGAGGLYAHGNTTELIEVRNTIIAYSLGYNAASIYPLEISEGSPRVTLEYSNLYAAEGEENHNLPSLDETTTTVEPGFLTYEADLPLDLHLSLESPLVNAGDPALTDPDGSRADPGAFGGPGGASWDVDLDGLMDYFWPGTLEDTPSGFDPTQFDANDLDLRCSEPPPTLGRSTGVPSCEMLHHPLATAPIQIDCWQLSTPRRHPDWRGFESRGS